MQLWWASSEQLVMWQLVSETSLPWSSATERPTLCIKISFRNSPTGQREAQARSNELTRLPSIA